MLPFLFEKSLIEVKTIIRSLTERFHLKKVRVCIILETLTSLTPVFDFYGLL
jgi:hypothetical protein